MSNVIKDFILYNLSKVDKDNFGTLSGRTTLGPFHIYRLSKGKRAKSGCEVCIVHLLRLSGPIEN